MSRNLDRFMFSFEENFDGGKTIAWMAERWHYMFLYAGLYILFVFFGPRWMKPYEKLELRKPFILWNAAITVFSIITAFRTLPVFGHILYHDGLHGAVCTNSVVFIDNAYAFWTFAFAISKIVQLGDTVFLVLRKQNILFVQWYHHMVSMVYVWYLSAHSSSNGHIQMEINCVVHIFLYMYFTAKSMKYNPPRYLGVVLVLLELLQMVVGFAVNLWTYYLLRDGIQCEIPMSSIKWSLGVNVSLFVLVAHLYYKFLYSKKKKQKNAD